LAVTDEVLVAKCQEGERTAFELLVQKYQRRIFQLIYRLTQDSDMVEPLAQEVFFKAFRAIKSFKGNSQFYTWLYRIAVNTCLSHLKRDSPEDPWENPAEAAGANQHSDGLQPDDPETTLLRKEFFKQLFGSLRRLPDDLRATLVLREFMGLNYEEIAEVMQIPLGTVRSRIFRARAQLRETMGSYLCN